MKARKTNIDPGPVYPPLNESPLETLPAPPFRCIAPPSRTPLTSANVLACPQLREDRQSGLSTNQSHRIYSPFGTGNVATVNISGSQPSPSVFKSSRPTVYQQKPRFHTHFYNNGPANYRDTRSNLGTFSALRSNHIPVPNPRFYLAEPMLPVSHVSWQQNIQNQVGLGEHFSQPVAPAIVLENTSKPMPLADTTLNNYSSKALSTTHTEDIDISAQYNLLISRMEASQAFPTFYNEVLDPSLAPLKHLTDVLGRFRDQDGTYTKLVDLQEREGLMKCLLDDDLARRSPFQAAMGLVLLSKLGLKWDYY